MHQAESFILSGEFAFLPRLLLGATGPCVRSWTVTAAQWALILHTAILIQSSQLCPWLRFVPLFRKSILNTYLVPRTVLGMRTREQDTISTHSIQAAQLRGSQTCKQIIRAQCN